MRYQRGRHPSTWARGGSYALSLRGAELERAEEEAKRRLKENRSSGYQNRYIHPKGERHQHRLGCYGELSVALGTGLEWTGEGQAGMQVTDAGHGVFPIEVKSSEQGSQDDARTLKITDKEHEGPQVPFVLVRLYLFDGQVSTYPIGWAWKSQIPVEGLGLEHLREFGELLEHVPEEGIL